jgi:Tfp pilus assembly protein PilF
MRCLITFFEVNESRTGCAGRNALAPAQNAGSRRRAALLSLLLALASTAVLAQSVKEIPIAGERAVPILEQLKLSPLAAVEKDNALKAYAAHDVTTVEKILVKAIEADPKSPDLLLLAARLFFLDRNPANAAIAFKKAEKIKPLTTPDRFTLAMAYVGIGKGEWARPELTRLATETPQSALYPYWLARIDYDQRNYAAASERLRGVLKTNPTFTKAWDVLGLSLEGDGKLEEAITSYKEAVRLNLEQKPQSAWPLLNLGTLLTKMDRLKDGEVLLREAIGIEAKLGEARYRLGVNLHKQNKDDEAMVEFKRAIEINPSAPESLYVLSQIYRSRGDTKAADDAIAQFKALKKVKRGE